MDVEERLVDQINKQPELRQGYDICNLQLRGNNDAWGAARWRKWVCAGLAVSSYRAERERRGKFWQPLHESVMAGIVAAVRMRSGYRPGSLYP